MTTCSKPTSEPESATARKKGWSPRVANLIVLATFILGFALMIMPHAVLAQSVNVDLGKNGSLSARVIQLIGLMTVLSLAPSIVIMTTSFVRIVVVLSLLRTALGLQQSPPNAVIISLSLFLSAIVMGPTYEQAYQDGIKPLMDQEIEMPQAFDAASAPIKAFMLAQVDGKDLDLFVHLSKIETPKQKMDLPIRVVTPAFMISELKKAFEIGFFLFLPFLVIDLVVSATLMSMGMVMLPPSFISLPFKILLFVLVDGWGLVTKSLVESFHT